MNNLCRSFQPILTETGLNRFGLQLEHSPACNILDGVVHSYLQITAKKVTPYPVIPDGTQAIFISPQNSMIGGTQTQARDIQLQQAGEYFGIRFYPGALRYFFNLNLVDITDQYVDPSYFSCTFFNELHNHLYQHNTFHEEGETLVKHTTIKTNEVTQQ